MLLHTKEYFIYCHIAKVHRLDEKILALNKYEREMFMLNITLLIKSWHITQRLQKEIQPFKTQIPSSMLLNFEMHLTFFATT